MLNNWANEALPVIESVKGIIQECCEEEKHK